MKHLAIALCSSVALLVGAVVVADPGPAPALAAPPYASPQESVADIVDRVLPSVVSITASQMTSRSRGGKSLGSGVILSANGYVVTNNHVVKNGRDITVHLADGRKFSARVVGSDKDTDLAVLKLQGKLGRLTPARVGSSSNMRLGETVLAVGNPFGVGQTVTRGIVSAKGRAGMGIVNYEDFIQTDAAINPGNSGGALINMRGEIIGINTAILSRTGGSHGIGFAIPTETFKPITKALIKHGKVSRGYLGVSIQTVDPALADTLKLVRKNGVLVTDVTGGSPAGKAGLRRNDVVVGVDGKSTKTAAQLRSRVAAAGAGTTVVLAVARGKQRMNLPIILGQLPGQYTGRGNNRPRAVPADDFGANVTGLTRRTRQRYNLPRNLTRGVVVTGIDQHSIASNLGLQPGDVILEVNRAPVASSAQFKSRYQKAGNRLALLVWRDGSTVYLMVSKR